MKGAWVCAELVEGIKALHALSVVKLQRLGSYAASLTSVELEFIAMLQITALQARPYG